MKQQSDITHLYKILQRKNIKDYKQNNMGGGGEYKEKQFFLDTTF
jgi:hypothetical protein